MITDEYGKIRIHRNSDYSGHVAIVKVDDNPLLLQTVDLEFDVLRTFVQTYYESKAREALERRDYGTASMIASMLRIMARV